MLYKILLLSVKPQHESAIGIHISSVTQSCPTLCDPMNCSTPGLPDHHQLLEFTQTHVHQVGDAISHIQLFATTWTVAHQALLSLGFSRQDYWSGLPCPPPGDLPNPGMKPTSLHLWHSKVGSLPLVLPGKPIIIYIKEQRYQGF